MEKIWGKAENYFIINLLRILHLFLLAVVGRLLFACRLLFSGIYAQSQVSEWISSSMYITGTTPKAR